MPGFLLWLLEALGGAAIKAWWECRENPPKEADDAVIRAENKEAAAFTRPPGDWHDTIDRL